MKRTTAVLVTLIVAVLSGLTSIRGQSQSSNQQPPPKFLQSDLPFEFDNSVTEFDFSFWLDPGSIKKGEVVTVFLENTPYIRFDKSKFPLQDLDHAVVHAKRLTKGPALVDVAADPDQGWAFWDRTVNFGFAAEIKMDAIKELRSGEQKAVSVKFFDAQGKRTGLKAPTVLRLVASNVQLREIGKEWNQGPLEIWLQSGVNGSPLIEVKSMFKTGGEGHIQAELMSNGQYVISSAEDLIFPISPAEWLVFLMAILGGLLHSIYELVSGLVKGETMKSLPTVGAKAIVGILSGIIAVLFADKVGIKIDTTSLTGYVALGFLVAYVGIDAVLKPK